MHISVFMGPLSFSASNDLSKIEMCLDQSLQCADAGFAMVTFGEQHLNGYEPYSNPLMMAAKLSGALGETWFGTTVMPPAFHHPLRLAEDSNIADLLLRGRFVMGISHGRTGPVPEWKVFGLDQADRDEIFITKLDFLQRAAVQKAGDDPLVMDTKWDRGVLTGRMMPLSWRKGGAQLAIGSSTDETIDDIGLRGLPLFMSPVRLPLARQKLARHRAALAQAKLTDAQLANAQRLSMITLLCVMGETEEEAWENAETLMGANPMMDRSTDQRSLRELASVDEEAIASGTDPSPRNSNWASSWLIVGSPDSVAGQLADYQAAGFEHVNVRFTAGIARPDLVARSYALFSQHVLPMIDNQLFPPLQDEEIEPEHTAPAMSGRPQGQGPGGGDFATRGVPESLSAREMK